MKSIELCKEFTEYKVSPSVYLEIRKCLLYNIFRLKRLNFDVYNLSKFETCDITNRVYKVFPFNIFNLKHCFCTERI